MIAHPVLPRLQNATPDRPPSGVAEYRLWESQLPLNHILQGQESTTGALCTALRVQTGPGGA